MNACGGHLLEGNALGEFTLGLKRTDAPKPRDPIGREQKLDTRSLHKGMGPR